MSREKLKSQIEKVSKLSIEYRKEHTKLDTMIAKVYEYHYSDVDCDYIIDSLDYGLSVISFNMFHKKLVEAIKKYKAKILNRHKQSPIGTGGYYYR